MTDDDRRLMNEHGISSETKIIFHFQGYRYERFADAVSYAEKQERGPEEKVPDNLA